MSKDKEQLIRELNKDLSLEYKSIIQYIHHVATVKGAKYQGMLEELEQHIGQEVQHALTLARQIDFLGGTPTTDVTEVCEAEDSTEALEDDLKLEKNQLERYRSRVGQADDMGLGDVSEALAPLLAETQEHVRDLETALH